MEMINSIEELRSSLTERLEKPFRGEILSVKPNKPMLVVYTGENAFNGKIFVESAMRRVWKNKTDSLCQIMLEGGVLPAADASVSDCNSVNEGNIHQYVETMFSKGQNFGDLSTLLVVFVHNAADFKSIEEFKSAYANINNMKEFLGGSTCTGVSIVMLDETFRHAALSKEIRAYVREQIEGSEQRVSRKTVLLSNRTKKGELLTGARINENFEIIGNMLVMMNCSCSDFTTVPDRFFTNVHPTVLTASYSAIKRPNSDICGVIINEILRWLENKVSDGENIGWDGICRCLEISGNTFPFLKQYYETKAKTQLAPVERLEFLPRMDITYTDSLLSLPFNQFKNMTMGGFEAYFKDNYEGVFKDRNGAFMDDFRREISAYIAQKIPAEMAINSLSEANIDNLMSGLSITSYEENAPAGAYIQGLLYNAFWDEAKVVFKEELIKRRRGASGHLGTITEMISAFIDSYDAPNDESVIFYYSQLVKQRLEENMGNKILERVNGMEKTSTNILSAVYESVCEFFDNESIFSLPLEKELTVRMGKSGVEVTDIIKTLTDPLTENRRLSTMFDPDPGAKFVMINKTNSLVEPMRNYFGNGSDAMFFNTGDSNSMAIVHLYECNATTLL